MFKYLFHSLIFITLTASAIAQQIEVPMEIQYNILLKVLSYDKNLSRFGTDEIRIGVFYQSGFKASAAAKDELSESISKSKIKDIDKRKISVFYSNLDYESPAAFIKEKKISVIYFLPLRAVSIENILTDTKKIKILSCSAVKDYLSEGVAISFALKSSKPEILVNLKAAKSEGTDFSSQLLKIVTVIE